ncbi:MAG TPA: hypothetical protein PK523_04955 [Elusimicrobiales bacterium]|nr:hypothetical protein [Elusimicrobiales bacterium]
MKKALYAVVVALLLAGAYAVAWAAGGCTVTVRNGTNNPISNITVTYKYGGQTKTSTFSLPVRGKRTFNADRNGSSAFYARYSGKTKSVICNSSGKIMALTN